MGLGTKVCVVTRLFPALTGYPQIRNSVLDIAHALWGALLPLLLANGWAFTLSALLSGLGVELFIPAHIYRNRIGSPWATPWNRPCSVRSNLTWAQPSSILGL